MDGPGTVTWEEFLENAATFLAVSDEVSDGWQLHGDKDTPGQAYIVRKVKRFVAANCLKDDESDDDGSDAEDFRKKFQEDPYEAPCAETPFITEHHILWSMSYGVPVLFFNGWKSDISGNNPVSVKEARKAYDSKLNYTQLSEAIHPILATPFLHLHPCLSQELLRNVPESKNKLVSWLSCVADAALNLKLHPEYYKLTY